VFFSGPVDFFRSPPFFKFQEEGILSRSGCLAPFFSESLQFIPPPFFFCSCIDGSPWFFETRLPRAISFQKEVEMDAPPPLEKGMHVQSVFLPPDREQGIPLSFC